VSLLEAEVGVEVEDPGGGFDRQREAVADKLGIDPDYIAEVKRVNDE
jgi:hypothetical protein